MAMATLALATGTRSEWLKQAAQFMPWAGARCSLPSGEALTPG
jgi:hypothetical protein